MNLIKDVTFTKVAATIVGVAMVSGLALAFAAERAHAITNAELIELLIQTGVIPADKAASARAAVQGSGTTTGGTTTGGSCQYTFTRSLKVGSTGTDVQKLQMFLNMSADTQVAAAGAGAPGLETMYFGPATKAAVAKFQVKYASDILSPLGLTMGTGYFGASTMAKANAVCAASGTTTPPTPTNPSTGTGTGTDTTLSGGEATLESLKLLSSPSGIEVADGDEDVKVAGFSFKVKDGDASIKRVDVDLEAKSSENTGANTGWTNKPWRVFSTAAVYLGDTKLGEMDVDRESDWTDLSSSDAYELRFTGLDGVVKEDDTANIYVVLSAQNNIDTKDENTKWTVTIPRDGIRARDGAGIDQYTSDGSVSRTFMTEGAGTGEKLKVTLDSSNPHASIIQVDSSNETKDQTVLVFDLQAKEHAIEVSSIPVTITSASSTVDLKDFLSQVKLDIDGTIYNDITPVESAATTTTQFVFDMSDNKLEIAKDDTVKVKVVVDFKQTGTTNGNYNTTFGDLGLTASVTSGDVAGIDAEGANTITDLSGSATGEQQTLLKTGISVKKVSTDASVRTINNGTEDVADFTVKFDATAFDDTYYVGSTTASVNYSILKDGVAVSTTTTANLTFSDTAESNGNFRINDGSTKTFTFKATVNPDVTGYYALRINSISYSASNSGAVNDLSAAATPIDDFKTAAINIAQ